MADLFTSLVAISPNQSKVSGNAATRIPGTSPQMKDGIWNERACAFGCNFSTLVGGLLGYWKLDSNALDSKGTYNGTIVGPVTYAPSKINDGAVFGAGSPRIDISPIPVWTGAVSVSVWINPATDRNVGATTPAGIVTGFQSNGYYHTGMHLRGDGTSTNFLTYSYNDTFMTGNDVSIPNSVWTHVVSTISSPAGLRFYVNGVRTVTPDFALGAIGLGVLNLGSGVFGSFKGGLDAVGVWDRQLTQTEITALYNAGTGVQYPF